MSKSSILSCGEVLWDLFPEGPRFGGAPANFACHAALLGGTVSILSAVGDDERGTEAIAILRGFGVDTSLVQRTPAYPTGVVRVSVSSDGKPSYDIATGAAWDSVTWSAEIATRLDAADAVYFGTLGQRSAASRETIRRSLEYARARGMMRVLDLNLRAPFFDDAMIRESVGLASVVKLSDEELLPAARACGIAESNDHAAMLASLREKFGLEVAAMTLGAEGALLVSPAGTVTQPGFPTVVRDTVGAGDSFTAALVMGLLRNESLAAIAHSACLLASRVCAQDGAVPVATGQLTASH